MRVVAPSGPFDLQGFERGLSLLRGRLGLEPRFREDVRTRRGYLAGDDARRLAEWREAAADPQARAIWCARGGYGAMRILEGVDPAPLLGRPRWLVGFSDVTALHSLLNQAGLETVHGPMVARLAAEPPESVEHLEALLFGLARRGSAPDGGPLPGGGVRGSAALRPGRAAGTLLGGSLALLAHLCGTAWQPRLAGAILFLEDVREKPYRLDRYFTQLRLAGALDGVAGVALGQVENGAGPGEEAGAETLSRLAAGLGVPAIAGVDAGHGSPNLALPLGRRVTLVAPGAGEPGPPRLLFGGEE